MVHGGCSAVRHPGFKDECCPSSAFSGTLHPPSFSEVTLLALLTKSLFFPPFCLPSRSTHGIHLPSQCRWCCSHPCGCPLLAELMLPFPPQLLSTPQSHPFCFDFSLPFRQSVQCLEFNGRVFPVPPGEGAAQPRVCTHRIPE